MFMDASLLIHFFNDTSWSFLRTTAQYLSATLPPAATHYPAQKLSDRSPILQEPDYHLDQWVQEGGVKWQLGPIMAFFQS